MTRPPLVVVIPKRASPPVPAQPHAAENHSYIPRQRPNPLTVAQHWLGRRLSERTLPDGSVGCFLDGRPTNLAATMRAANAVLKANGVEQIGTNPRWVV